MLPIARSLSCAAILLTGLVPSAIAAPRHPRLTPAQWRIVKAQNRLDDAAQRDLQAIQACVSRINESLHAFAVCAGPHSARVRTRLTMDIAIERRFAHTVTDPCRADLLRRASQQAIVSKDLMTLLADSTDDNYLAVIDDSKQIKADGQNVQRVTRNCKPR